VVLTLNLVETREDHISIPYNCDQEGTEPLDDRVDPQTKMKRKKSEVNAISYPP
jgi:hypothetical protein